MKPYLESGNNYFVSTNGRVRLLLLSAVKLNIKNVTVKYFSPNKMRSTLTKPTLWCLHQENAQFSLGIHQVRVFAVSREKT